MQVETCDNHDQKCLKRFFLWGHFNSPLRIKLWAFVQKITGSVEIMSEYLLVIVKMYSKAFLCVGASLNNQYE